MIIEQIFSKKRNVSLLIIYWLSLCGAFVINAARNRFETNYFIWLGLAILPFINNSIKNMRLLPDLLEVDYIVCGFFLKTKRFPLRTSKFDWEQVTSFRGGTHPFLILRASSTMRIGAIDGFDIFELKEFYHSTLKAQKGLD